SGSLRDEDIIGWRNELVHGLRVWSSGNQARSQRHFLVFYATLSKLAKCRARFTFAHEIGHYTTRHRERKRSSEPKNVWFELAKGRRRLDTITESVWPEDADVIQQLSRQDISSILSDVIEHFESIENSASFDTVIAGAFETLSRSVRTKIRWRW